MKSVRHRCIQQFIVLAAIACSAVTSAAPVKGSGTWVDCGIDATLVVSTAGPNTKYAEDLTQDFLTGPLFGQFAGTEYGVVKGSNATFHGDGTFTGTIAGVGAGTAAFRYEGIASFTGGPDLGGQAFRATFVMEGETGSLASVTAHGTFVGTVGTPATYCGGNGNAGSYEIAVSIGH
jgi:hypothetical protein